MTIHETRLLKDVQVDPALPLFADTETIGLYGQVRLLQLYQETWDKVILVDTPNILEMMLFIDKHNSVWHNAHYDLTTVQQQSGITWCPKNFEDTFLASRLAQPQFLEYSLDAVMARCIGHDPYAKAGLDKKKLQKSDWSKLVLTDDQLLYAAIDVYYMPQVWDEVCSAITTPSYKLDKLTVRHCLSFQWNGSPVDSKRLFKKYRETEADLAKISMPINANSWQQVRAWLGVDKSDKQFLSELELRDGNERAGNVLKVRKLRKLISFMDKYDKERVIGKFKPSTRSGRLSSDDENKQQIPRALKEVFGYPEDSNRVLIYSDYAQLELRTICAILGVSMMEKLFRAGEDLHGFVAQMLFGDSWTKKDRQVTKTYNFNLLYGGSVGMVCSILITYGLWVEQRAANKHKRKWLNLFPEIDKWQQESTSAFYKGKMNSTPFGRQYKAKLMTDFMNIQNQGAGAEVAKLALHYFTPRLAEYNKSFDADDAVLCNFIHDSFIIDAPDEPKIYKDISLMLAECMQEAWFEMSKLYKIKDLPMPVDVKVGKNWGDLEEDVNVIYDFTLEPYKMLEKTNG